MVQKFETLNRMGKGRGFDSDQERLIEGPDTDWDHRADSYIGSWVTDRNYILSIMEDGEIRRRGHEVLEIAGGGGFLATEISRSVRRVDAVDLSTGMLHLGQRTFDNRMGGNGELVTFTQSDAGRLPFKSGSYDRVVVRSFLHHAEEPQAVVNEAVRVTKVGGKVVLSEGTPPSLEPEVIEDYRKVFALKERRRLVFDADLGETLFGAGVAEVRTRLHIMRGVSVGEWLAHSGLDEETQREIVRLKLEQSEESRKAYQTMYVLESGLVVMEAPRDLDEVADMLETWRFVNVIGAKE